MCIRDRFFKARRILEMFGASVGHHDGSNHQTSVCCEKLADLSRYLIKDGVVKATILSELFYNPVSLQITITRLDLQQI